MTEQKTWGATPEEIALEDHLAWQAAILSDRRMELECEITDHTRSVAGMWKAIALRLGLDLNHGNYRFEDGKIKCVRTWK